ncbi:hypothetical protein B7Y92_01210 [Candidatus Saccharibacteria bacterium 32-50-13]|nr:MAG: hypothetical protein B7Y92_01210 [Candidatus Saccharibacteria bacterium 32-50-13]
MSKISKSPNPRIGIGTFVFRNGKFLMQQRQGSHGEGTWSVPGGHLEYGETPEDTSRREVLEETGCEIKNIRFAAVTNDFFEGENRHYVTWWTMSDWKANEPYITEPDKCIAQMWADFDNLPQPLFLPWEQLLKSKFLDDIKRELKRSKQ